MGLLGKIFTWWDGATIGTLFNSAMTGEHVGTDGLGNRYYRARKVRKARRHVLELLLSEHYGECTSCVRNGNCELQALAEEYGITEFAFGHPDEHPAAPAP